jgi:hypothetical protein
MCKAPVSHYLGSRDSASSANEDRKGQSRIYKIAPTSQSNEAAIVDDTALLTITMQQSEPQTYSSFSLVGIGGVSTLIALN